MKNWSQDVSRPIFDGLGLEGCGLVNILGCMHSAMDFFNQSLSPSSPWSFLCSRAFDAPVKDQLQNIQYVYGRVSGDQLSSDYSYES